jgi:CubicO group peptidase (beta-lactamase class C family)
LAELAAFPLQANSPDGCGIPVARDDGWRVASIDDGRLIDRGALCRMADRLAASSKVHAVLVARGGRLVFERYFSGPDEVQNRRVRNVTFDADTLHDMKSVSKSVASLALGIAIDRGLIGSIDAPVFSFFPELSDLRSPEKDRIRLSHVLTMSMGLRWVEATPDTGDDDNDEARMHRAPDPCRYVLGLPVTAPAGQEFFYNTGALTLLSAIVRKATGRPLDEFARATLFEPLGITGVEWTRVKGDSDAGGGLRLRPHATWRRSVGSSLPAAAGMTVRSFRRRGSTRR